MVVLGSSALQARPTTMKNMSSEHSGGRANTTYRSSNPRGKASVSPSSDGGSSFNPEQSNQEELDSSGDEGLLRRKHARLCEYNDSVSTLVVN